MQNLGVTAEAKSVLNLLQPGVQYRIPSYQRSYSWQVSDATALIDDLIVGLDEDRPHFLGAIVTVKTSVPGLFEVVDAHVIPKDVLGPLLTHYQRSAGES